MNLTPSALVYAFGERHAEPRRRATVLGFALKVLQGSEIVGRSFATVPSGAQVDGVSLAAAVVTRAAWNLHHSGLVELTVQQPAGAGEDPESPCGEVSFAPAGSGEPAAGTLDAMLHRHLAKTKGWGKIAKAVTSVPTGVLDALTPASEPDHWELGERIAQGPHWQKWVNPCRDELAKAGALGPEQRGALEAAHAAAEAEWEQFKQSQPELHAALAEACGAGVATAQFRRTG